MLCGIKAEIESYVAPTVPIVGTDKTFRPWLPPTPRVQALVEFSPALLHEHTATELAQMTSTIQDMVQACFAPHGTFLGPLSAQSFVVVPHAKFWLLHVDVIVVSWSGGNVLDAVFASLFRALWDTRLPATHRLVPDQTQDDSHVGTDDPAGLKFITRGHAAASAPASHGEPVDFALSSDWAGGEPLAGREEVPVCVSVYPVRDKFLLDPTREEELALTSSVAVLASARGQLYGVRQRGTTELSLDTVLQATDVGVYYARRLAQTLQDSAAKIPAL